MHELVVECRACPPWKPDKRCIRQFPQAELLQSDERMSFWRCQFNVVYSDGELVQFRIGFGHEIDEPRIQAAGPYSLQLFRTRCRTKLQFRVGLVRPKSPEGIRDN